MFKEVKKKKWPFILKYGLIWALVCSSMVQIYHLIFNREEVGASVWLQVLSGIIGGTVIIFPIGMVMGFYMWKSRRYN
ncbi:hypothetical protein GCM10008967_32620 [Bacillus carboniphilus]|uniref:Uncharacterized protein n=1 Tax=Bacillus carboniphilus TaxID=86663 RepID=A0ABP3GA49_9BACI